MRSRNYDREFKLNAVKLHADGNKKASKICKDLGIPDSTFFGWVREYQKNGENSFRGSGKIKSSNEDLYKLKKELKDTQMERVI
jgi:transposase